MFRSLFVVSLISMLAVPALGQTTAADADFDGSGTVDIADFLQFVNAFGTTNAKYDLDGSGEVDIADFLQFVNVYGQKVQAVPVGSVDRDRAALVALYHATDGENWENNTNWLSNQSLNEWYGVLTNAQGRVDSLILSSNRLSGPIPDSLRNLSNLEFLGLGTNQLSGPIPEWVGTLTNLRHLALENNQLSGPIPSSLGNLSNLESFRVDKNQLSGPVPMSISKIVLNLEYMFLHNNDLCLPSALKEKFPFIDYIDEISTCP